jgi:hypothetical protein
LIEKERERLSLSKRATQKFDMERLNFKKLNGMDVKEEHQIKLQTNLLFWKKWMIMWKPFWEDNLKWILKKV